MMPRYIAVFAAVLLLSFQAQARATCAKDADCKGDRICEDGKCISPTSGKAQPPPGLFEASPRAPEAAPSAQPAAQYYWVGIAWGKNGTWVTRTATSRDEAQTRALDICNKNAEGCVNVANPVPGDRYMCFALYRDGNDMYESHDPNLQAAENNTLQACQDSNDPGPGCHLEISGCNDHE